MRISVYGDVHLNKNMRSLQDLWNVTAMKSLISMYDHFDELDVELAICLGDFLDTPRLEAKDMSLVLPILDSINRRAYPTYILLGNHESYDENSNILEYLSVYDNIHPVTSAYVMEDLCFIPYYEDPTSIDMEDKIVFTHHDIYGSSLASGKTKAFFGIDPKVFEKAKLVMNGHVHLKSKVSKNIINTGSLLVSQQGELKLGDHPSYYIVDTKDASYEEYNNHHSMIYLTIDVNEAREVVQHYDPMHVVLKVEYTDEIPETYIGTAHTSWRKKLSSIDSSEISVHQSSTLDLKNYIVKFIEQDPGVLDEFKKDLIDTVEEVLS